MASTTYGLNDALAVKLWGRDLYHEAVKATEIFPLIGNTPNAIIQRRTETSKGKGDRITVGLRMQLTGDGLTENEVAEGNLEALTTYSDNLFINELGWGVGIRSENEIDAQRVNFDMRDEAKAGLTDWWSRRISVSFFNQVCGNTATSGASYPTSVKYTGMNAATAPTAGRVIRGGGAATDVLVNGTSAYVMTLSLIDSCVEVARTGGTAGLPLIRPVRVEGDDMYVMYLHPYQVTSLRTNTSAGQWLDIQKAAMTGGNVGSNPIFTGALGVYNQVVLRMSEQIPLGVNATTGAQLTSTRRAVFLGAQSAAIAFGMDNTENTYRWNEELLDHKRRLEISSWTIMGMKKLVFNSTDFGCIVVPTYATAAA